MLRIVSKEDSRIRLSAKGLWFHLGQAFENRNVIRFFHRVIRKDENGEYYLYNSHANWEEHVYFKVDDTAYFVWSLVFDPEGRRFHILLNTGATEVLNVHTFEEDHRGVMYCQVLEGDRARFSQEALTELADYAKTDEHGIFIDATGEKIYISDHSGA
jgi:hypothetical protein